MYNCIVWCRYLHCCACVDECCCNPHDGPLFQGWSIGSGGYYSTECWLFNLDINGHRYLTLVQLVQHKAMYLTNPIWWIDRRISIDIWIIAVATVWCGHLSRWMLLWYLIPLYSNLSWHRVLTRVIAMFSDIFTFHLVSVNRYQYVTDISLWFLQQQVFSTQFWSAVLGLRYATLRKRIETITTLGCSSKYLILAVLLQRGVNIGKLEGGCWSLEF